MMSDHRPMTISFDFFSFFLQGWIWQNYMVTKHLFYLIQTMYVGKKPCTHMVCMIMSETVANLDNFPNRSWSADKWMKHIRAWSSFCTLCSIFSIQNQCSSAVSVSSVQKHFWHQLFLLLCSQSSQMETVWSTIVQHHRILSPNLCAFLS